MIERFASLVGKDDAFELGPQEDLSRWFVMQPRVAVKPREPEQCANVLALASQLRAAVVPWGGGQHQDLGNVPRPVEVLLSTTGMTGIVEYDPADETVVVRAGTRFADLVARLREDRLMLPVDPSGLGKATIGGIVAANVTGPLRAGYGRPRDYVLGTKAAYSDGVLAKSGGRLVKNVTGFDLHRLHCGSLGSLGVLCEIALRLRPIPEREASAILFCDSSESLDAVLSQIRSHGDEPVSCIAIDAPSLERLGTALRPTPADSFVLALRFHGLHVAVERALVRASDAAMHAGGVRCERVEGADETGFWASLRECRAKFDPRGGGVVIRLTHLPFQMEGGSATSRVGGVVDALYARAAGVDVEFALVAEPLQGSVRIYLDSPPSDAVLAAITSLATERDGVAATNFDERALSIEGGPAEWRARRDVHFGRLENAKWMARLKRSLDPAAILSPGRIVAGGEA